LLRRQRASGETEGNENQDSNGQDDPLDAGHVQQESWFVAQKLVHKSTLAGAPAQGKLSRSIRDTENTPKASI
jgi:hypothetical protein